MDNTAQEKEPQNYFVTDLESQNFQEENFQEKLRPVKHTAEKGLIKIWPALTRGINTFLYYSLKIVRSAINIAISQLK